MLPQRQKNEKMEDYFHRTTLELGTKFDGEWYTTSYGSKTQSAFFAWYMQTHAASLKTRNQY